MNEKRFPMKLFTLVLGAFLILFVGCKRENTRVFDESPDTRINKLLTQYQSALTSSPAGWNATIRTGTGGVFHFHFRYNESNRVFMFADINLQTATTEKESSYRLKAVQTPALIFDTYSYLHILSDPDGSVNGGTNGQGLISDFEFGFDSLATDSILLTGRVNKTKLTLIKSTQEDFDSWQNGSWANVLAFENINKITNYFKRMTVNGVTYEIRADLVARTITLTWVDSGGSVHQFTTGYDYGPSGIVFSNPLINGSQTINGFEIVGWDAINSVVNVKVNGSATTIAGATQPLKVDVNAPRRWWQYAIDNGGVYWFSIDGFHVNGVDDAFGIKTLPNYYYLIYWPAYDPGNNDLFAPVFLNSAGNGLELLYGLAPDTPQFTVDGRAVFSALGVYGTYPSSGPAAQSRTQLLIPQGYYFVQTGPTTYDMVSATDAKAWVSWQF